MKRIYQLVNDERTDEELMEIAMHIQQQRKKRKLGEKKGSNYAQYPVKRNWSLLAVLHEITHQEQLLYHGDGWGSVQKISPTSLTITLQSCQWIQQMVLTSRC
jgi:hypothetical protein